MASEAKQELEAQKKAQALVEWVFVDGGGG